MGPFSFHSQVPLRLSRQPWCGSSAGRWAIRNLLLTLGTNAWEGLAFFFFKGKLWHILSYHRIKPPPFPPKQVHSPTWERKGWGERRSPAQAHAGLCSGAAGPRPVSLHRLISVGGPPVTQFPGSRVRLVNSNMNH